MWEDPVFLQSYFNTDFQTLQTTNPDKVPDCADVASVFSKLEHERERSYFSKTLHVQVQVRNLIFQDVFAVNWSISAHFPSAYCYTATTRSFVQTKLKNILFKKRNVRVYSCRYTVLSHPKYQTPWSKLDQNIGLNKHKPSLLVNDNTVEFIFYLFVYDQTRSP